MLRARLKLYACTLLSPEPTGPAAALLMRGRTLPLAQNGLIPEGNWKKIQECAVLGS